MGFRVLNLEPGLNRLVLGVEICHIGHQILDDIHMRERVDGALWRLGVDTGQACERVGTWCGVI